MEEDTESILRQQGRNVRALSERIRRRQTQLERSQHRNDSASQKMDHAEEYQRSERHVVVG